MNFQDLKHIEDHKTYIDTAFRKAKKSKDPKGRIEAFSDYLIEALQKIIYSYPSIDSLPEFYAELVRTQLDYRYIKKSLGAVDGAINKLKEFKRKFVRDPGKLKQFYGRASSVIKKIKGNLDYLEEARKVMKDFPAVKTSLYTVALYGLPNVGKTTVLSELTPSEAEINTYPFTTKKINIGYIMNGNDKIQILDTPGSLNRQDKMNKIEMQAELAIKYCADMIVFVYGPEEDTEKQDKLFDKIKKKFRRKTIIPFYRNKDDVKELKKRIISSQQ